MITPLPPGLSPQAQAVLATAPPDRLPFAVNRVTARVMRAVFARRRQPDLDAAYTRWPAPTVPGRVGPAGFPTIMRSAGRRAGRSAPADSDSVNVDG